jgi:flagella synthesis protein FlgN
MKTRDALSRIFADMCADVEDYVRLRDLLEEQFGAALQHRTDEIGAIGVRITELAAILEERRRERVRLAGVLAVSPAARPSMAAVVRHLQGTARTRFAACWSSLEALVRECKALNLRNCHLLMDQQDIMRRVLDTQVDIYAPA